MTRETFITIFQGWMRTRGLNLTNDGLALSEEGERLALMELCGVVHDADSISSRATRQISPEALEAALAAAGAQ